MSENTEIDVGKEEKNKEKAEKLVIIYAYYDGKNYNYSLWGTGPFREIFRQFLILHGAKKEIDAEGYMGELYRTYIYYEAPQEIDFTNFFCNVSIVWLRTYDSFLEYCE